MIDQFSTNRDGWARFSDDETRRFRLARALDPSAHQLMVMRQHHDVWLMERGDIDRAVETMRRVVFVLLNPSTATAFKPDPTVSRCCEFARRWGADVLEVVNLYALRSPDPTDLDRYIDEHGVKALCEDVDNDCAIANACEGADIVVAAWGNNAWRGGRGDVVRDMLTRRGVVMQHLGMTKEGRPLHPLARGKSFIPYERKLTVWS